MSIQGWNGATRWLLVGVALAAASGCASAPPVPEYAKQRPEWRERHMYDEEGWLANRLMGRVRPEPPEPASAVVPASATEPAGIELLPDPTLPEPVLPPGLPPEPLPLPPGLGPDAARAYPPPGHRPPTIAVSQADIDGDDRLRKEKSEGFSLASLSPNNVYKNVKAAAGYGPDETIARTAYQEGEALFREKKYTEAAEKFKTAAGRWPDSILEEDALFLLGESHFFADDYPKAHDTFSELLKKYENTRYLETVVSREFSIGRYWEQLYTKSPSWAITPNVTDATRPRFDAFGNALEAYQNVRLYDPTGPLADDALMATANAHFLQGEYENAAFHYDQLRRDYPTSEHQQQAHLLGLQSKLLVYQGREYDGTPLDEAEKIARQLLTQFGRELGTERERVAAAHKQILEKMAERDWAMAEYYETKRSYKSARYYYNAIIRDHAGTRHAEMAQARLEAIRDKPDDPPNYFGWLEKLDPKKR